MRLSHVRNREKRGTKETDPRILVFPSLVSKFQRVHSERWGGAQEIWVSVLFPLALKDALVYHGMKSSKAKSKRRVVEEEGDSRHLRLCSCLLVADKEQGPGQDEAISLRKDKPEKLSMDTRLPPLSRSQSQMTSPFTQMPWGRTGGEEGHPKALKTIIERSLFELEKITICNLAISRFVKIIFPYSPIMPCGLVRKSRSFVKN